MYVDWEKIIKERKFCPAEIWNKLMIDTFKIKEELTQAQKTRAKLLAKNPNHFRDLAIKSHEKRRLKNVAKII